MIVITSRYPSLHKSFSVAPVKVRVTGRNGYKLQLGTIELYRDTRLLPVSVDNIFGGTVYSASVNITSDDFETTYDVLNFSPTYGAIYMVVALVVDANNNPVEHAEFLIIHSVNKASVTVPSGLTKNAEAFYVTRFGYYLKFVFKPGETIYVPRDIPIAVWIWWDGHFEAWDSGSKLQSVDADSAIVPLKITIKRDVAKALANLIENHDIAQVLYKVPEITDIVGAVRLVHNIFESGMHKLAALGATVYYDSDYVYVEAVTYVDLHTPLDIWTIVRFVAGIGLIIVGAVVFAFTLGAAVPAWLSAFAIGFSWTFGALILAGIIPLKGSSSQNVPTILPYADVTIQEAVKKMTETRNALSDYLNQLVAQGKITQDEANKILGYVDEIISVAVGAMKNLRNMIKSAYDEGYKKGKDEMMKWIPVAAAGGVLIGVLLGQRVVVTTRG